MTENVAVAPRERGHIRRRGSSFQVLVYAGMDPVTGRNSYLTESVPVPAGRDGERSARRKAERARTRMLAEAEGARAARTTATVARAVEEWFAVAELEASTRSGYRRHIDRYIVPVLGSTAVKNLKVQTLDQYYELAAAFEAVTREVGLLSGADLARMERATRLTGPSPVSAAGAGCRTSWPSARFDLDGLSVARDVRQTGGPVRLETFAGATGGIAREAHDLGIRSSVGCPIVVARHLWGVIAASTTSDEPFPAHTESQMARFTQLVATAVENAEARAELRRVADEQAALRRVATLVARGVAPEPVFAAVADEVGQLTGADGAMIFRFDADGIATVMAMWGLSDDDGPGVGARRKPEPPAPAAAVLATGHSAGTTRTARRSGTNTGSSGTRASGRR